MSLITSGFALLGPISSSIAAPALDHIGEDLHISPGVTLQLVLSIYLLTAAIAPFVIAPCSEIWGRVRPLRTGNVIFIVFTLACGFAKTAGQMIAFRFFAGVGGSAALGMGSGVLTDCWRSEERGRGLAIYQLGESGRAGKACKYANSVNSTCNWHCSWTHYRSVRAILKLRCCRQT